MINESFGQIFHFTVFSCGCRKTDLFVKVNYYREQRYVSRVMYCTFVSLWSEFVFFSNIFVTKIEQQIQISLDTNLILFCIAKYPLIDNQLVNNILSACFRRCTYICSLSGLGVLQQGLNIL